MEISLSLFLPRLLALLPWAADDPRMGGGGGCTLTSEEQEVTSSEAGRMISEAELEEAFLRTG